MRIVALSRIFHEQSTAWVGAEGVGIVTLSSMIHEQSTAWVGAEGVGIVALSRVFMNRVLLGLVQRVWELLHFPVFS